MPVRRVPSPYARGASWEGGIRRGRYGSAHGPRAQEQRAGRAPGRPRPLDPVPADGGGARPRAARRRRVAVRAEVGRLPRARSRTHPASSGSGRGTRAPCSATSRSSRPLGDVLPPRSALDGEIVIVRDGVLDFDAMQTRLHPAESRVRKLSAEIPARFVAFDVLVWDGVEHWQAPLAERRATLEEVGDRSDPLAAHARPRRGALVAGLVRGDRARRRDREAPRQAPTRRARARRSRR